MYNKSVRQIKVYCLHKNDLFHIYLNSILKIKVVKHPFLYQVTKVAQVKMISEYTNICTAILSK